MVLSLILGFGSFTQTLFINGVLGQADSIYESLTPSGFMQPQSFTNWILSFYYIGHLPLSVVACYVVFKQRNLRSVFLSLTVVALLVLMVADTAFALLVPEVSHSLPESFLSNLLGSPIIAFFLCLLLLYSKKISDQINLQREFPKAIVPILLCAISFFVIFIAVQNLFWVSKSKVSAIVKPPFDVSYGASLIKKDKGRFGVFWDTRVPPEKLSWTGKLVKMRLASGHVEKQPTISLYLFEGCPNKKTTELLALRSNPVISNITTSKIGFAISDGMADFSIYAPKKSNGYWSASGDEAMMFSVKPTKNKEKLDITTFSSEEMTIFHRDWDNETYYRFDSFLIGEHDLQARYAAISTDAGTTTFSIIPNPHAKVDDKLRCAPLSGANNYIAEVPIFTALIKITYPKAKVYTDLDIEHETRITGLNGWLSADEVAPSELGEYFSNGQLDLLSVQGAFEDLVIDGENQQLRRKSWLYLQGGTVSASVEDGSVRFDADTDVAALDGERISKTRWEKIAPAIKWLLVLLPGVLGYFLTIFGDAWKRNELLLSKAKI